MTWLTSKCTNQNSRPERASTSHLLIYSQIWREHICRNVKFLFWNQSLTRFTTHSNEQFRLSWYSELLWDSTNQCNCIVVAKCLFWQRANNLCSFQPLDSRFHCLFQVHTDAHTRSYRNWCSKTKTISRLKIPRTIRNVKMVESLWESRKLNKQNDSTNWRFPSLLFWHEFPDKVKAKILGNDAKTCPPLFWNKRLDAMAN